MVPLLKDSSNVGVRGVSGETDGKGGIWMGEEGGLGKSIFGSLERGGHRGSPVEGARRTLKSISEGLENTGGMRKEMVVEVNKAEEALKIFNSVWLGIVKNGVYIGGEGSDASGSDHVTEKRERRLSKGALGQIDQETIGFEDVKAGSEMGEV